MRVVRLNSSGETKSGEVKEIVGYITRETENVQSFVR